MAKIADATEKIGKHVIAGYQKMENGVVQGYKNMEGKIVDGFTKVCDTCINTLFAKEGERVEDAKIRLSNKR